MTRDSFAKANRPVSQMIRGHIRASGLFVRDLTSVEDMGDFYLATFDGGADLRYDEYGEPLDGAMNFVSNEVAAE